MTKAKILIAKGQSKTTLQIKTRLSRLGYKVTAASTTPSIFKNIEKKKPDLILLDPEIEGGADGIKIASEICSSFAIPVVLLDRRANTQSYPTTDSVSSSFDCVSRPYRREDLHAAIQLALLKHVLRKPDDNINSFAIRSSQRTSFAYAEEALQARERFMALLNDMTKKILLSKDFQRTLSELAVDMAHLLQADVCYITRWDSELNAAVPSASMEGQPFPDFGAIESSLTTVVSQAGHAIAVDDILDSPFVTIAEPKKLPIYSLLGIPLIAINSKLGAALVCFKTHHHFTAEEIQWAEQAGNQIALALWSFQQSNEIEQRLKENSALAEIGRALSKTERVGTGKVLQLIVDSARDLIPQAEESVIHLLDLAENILIAQAVSGFGDREWGKGRVKMRLGEGVAGTVIREGITINVRDVHHDPNFVSKGSTPDFCSLLVAPVQSGAQQIGTISVQSKNTNAFFSRDEQLLNALGVQAAIAIENTHLFESIQQHLKEVDALYRTSQRLASSLNADELIEDVITLLMQNFGYYHAQIFLRDPATDDLILKKASGSIGEELLQHEFRLPRGTGIIGHVAETGEPFVTNDVNNVVFFYRNPLLPETHSEMTVPIKVQGNVVGILDIQDTSPRRLTESDLQLMIAVADQLAVALQKANLHSNLETALQQEQTIRSQLIQSERLALVGRLLASVSHELNNPLQAIQNALFLLKDETSLSGQAGQDLEIILSETERMAALIERLRSAYRPIRMTDFQSVSLNSLIEDVFMLMSTHMRHREVVFEFFPEPELPPVDGISDQLRQVVLNLFLNAVEVMKPGGRLTVQTHSLSPQNEVLLTVRDSGPGIPPEILPKIFDPFITTKHTGTGLGLTITHDIVEQHHGRILAENHPEGGAIFYVWLTTREGDLE